VRSLNYEAMGRTGGGLFVDRTSKSMTECTKYEMDNKLSKRHRLTRMKAKRRRVPEADYARNGIRSAVVCRNLSHWLVCRMLVDHRTGSSSKSLPESNAAETRCPYPNVLKPTNPPKHSCRDKPTEVYCRGRIARSPCFPACPRKRTTGAGQDKTSTKYTRVLMTKSRNHKNTANARTRAPTHTHICPQWLTTVLESTGWRGKYEPK